MNKIMLALLEKGSIDLPYLEFRFGIPTINRGFRYFKQDYVLKTKETSLIARIAGTKRKGTTKKDSKNITKKIINSEVAGSYRKKYQTKVILSEKKGKVDVSSSCSCPVGTDCKHGIATLFYYLDQVENNTSKKEDKNTRVEQWLENLSATNKLDKPIINQENKTHSSLFHLIFILGLTSVSKELQLYVRVCKARKLKTGAYGVANEIPPYELDEYYANRFNATKEQLTLAKGIKNLPCVRDYTSSQQHLLDDDIAELFLTKILKTKHCFFENDKGTPIKQGFEREIQFNWKKKGQFLVPASQCEPKIDEFVSVNRLYYIDFEHHEIGLLTHPSMNHQQLIGFLQAPRIPLKQAEQISEQLLNLMPEADLPLPAKIEIETREIAQKTPKITLNIHVKTIDSRIVHIATLSFQYHDFPLKITTQEDINKTPLIFIKDKVRYKIHRDLEIEKQAKIQLYQNQFFNGQEIYSQLQLNDFILDPTQPLSEEVLQWDNLRSNIFPKLIEAGWDIIFDDNFTLEVDYIDDWVAEIDESEGNDWFEMTLGFELKGQKINLLPLLVKLLAENPDTQQLHQTLKQKSHQLFQLSEQQWVQIPTQRILMILDTLIELYDTKPLNEEGNFEFSKYSGLNYGDLLNDPKLKWKGAKQMQTLTKKIANFSGIRKRALPRGLKAELRDYQQVGFNWLNFLRDFQFNGVLADDMGLGKTVQTLTMLLSEKQKKRAKNPTLIIAPTSLMSNWRNEVEKFTPKLTVLTLQGAQRKEHFNKLLEFDLILTTYPLIRRDKAIYENQQFHYLILDEAQAIKNVKSQTSQIIYKLKANHRLCVTGTPIENHLGELWSMFHFLMPGYLGKHEQFNRLFRKPIEKEGNSARGIQLRKRTTPFMLRRTKDLVAKELPKKTEIIRSVPLSGKQRDLYETVRLAMDKKVRAEIKKKGLARSHITILDALLKLRQVCCDPKLVKLTKAKNVKESAKLDLLMEMLPEMIEEGRKILLFSQFTSMLSIIRKELTQHKIKFSILTGQTRKREEAINAFQKGDAKVFLISLKAGGVGLNLTAADTVIHYDPWWNPAVEQQATDRAYRIGQDKPVFVYKLIIEESVEEKIIVMQAKKQALADSLYGDKKQNKANFGKDDLMDLLAPLK